MACSRCPNHHEAHLGRPCELAAVQALCKVLELHLRRGRILVLLRLPQPPLRRCCPMRTHSASSATATSCKLWQ